MGRNDAAAIPGFPGAPIEATKRGMTSGQRKFVGSIGLVVFSVVYYLFVISVALARLPDLATGWHILFYFISVVIWFIPSAMIVRWTVAARPN
jgi:uncharacterized membrane protein YhaH (DUF805 family)